MNLSSALSADVYLTNKEYFDQSLIRILQKQKSQITILKKQIGIKTAVIHNKNGVITVLRLKYKDLQAVFHNFKTAAKDSDSVSDKAIKDMEKEIRNIQKQIDGELQRQYTENTHLHDEIQKIKKENEILKRERDKYKKMACQNSSNSSKPPSTDRFTQPPVSLRTSSNRKAGGQKGHPVHRSKISKTPTHIIDKRVTAAPTGAAPVFNDAGRIEYYVTQEIDARFVTTVTETRYYITEGGETLETNIMSRYRINSITYANSFKSTVIYLNSKGTIPLERLCTILKELSHGEIELKPGTVTNWNREFYELSEGFRKQVLEELLNTKAVYVDETGWKVNGKNHWMQIMCTEKEAYFVCTKKRSDDEEGPLKLLENYIGILMHDHFKSYYRLEQCTHAECNVHILRYLRSGIDFYDSIECAEMVSLLVEMNQRKKELARIGKTEMEKVEVIRYEERFMEIIKRTTERYYENNPNIARKYVPEYIKTMERLEKFKKEHLYFIKDFNAPFENNRAERQARSVKAKKKVSGQSKNIATANTFAAIQTVNQTCVLRDMNTLETIEDILNGKDVFCLC